MASSNDPPRPGSEPLEPVGGSQEVLAPWGGPGQTDPVLPGGPPGEVPPERTGILGGAPRWLVVLTLVIAIVGVTGYVVHIPYYSVGPGPSVDVLTLVDVRGAKTYTSRGKLLLTTASVSVSTDNLWAALADWLNPNVILVPRDQLVPPGVTTRDADIENQLEMEASKFSAEVAAFRALGFAVEKIPGARILTVVDGTPAFGKLRAGDLIESVDGKPVTGLVDTVQLLSKHKAGDVVQIAFERDETLHSITLKTIASSTKPVHAVIGVTLSSAFKLPHDVEIDTQRIVGPSGGMIFALAIYDVFTPGDLTGGHIIAGTGEILIDPKTGAATVGDIGAIEETVRTARAHGADIFLAPADQAAAARAVAPKSMRVIGVSTLDEALRILKALPPLSAKAA
jgi:PDZ domain-containing protein